MDWRDISMYGMMCGFRSLGAGVAYLGNFQNEHYLYFEMSGRLCDSATV